MKKSNKVWSMDSAVQQATEIRKSLKTATLEAAEQTAEYEAAHQVSLDAIRDLESKLSELEAEAGRYGVAAHEIHALIEL